jgi:hypothetical protein
MLIAVALPACGDTAGSGEDGAMEEAEALVVDAVVGGGPVSDSVPPIALWRARSLAAWGAGLAVVDNGNDRVVVVDRELRVKRTVGRTGAGPGEFEQPVSAHALGDGLVVAELGNRRFTELGPDGEVRRAWPAPNAGVLSMAVDGEGRIYAPSRRPGDYLVRITGDSAQPFGARPDTVAPDTLQPAVGPPDPHVAVTAGDTVHVIDNVTGVLSKFGPDGTLVMRRSLPRSLLDSLIDRRNATIENVVGGDVRSISVPLIKDLSTTSGGALLLLVTEDRAGGLLIDPGTYRARRIIAPDAHPRWTWLLRATDAVFIDPLLYVLASDSLVVYRTRSAR